VRVLEVHDPIGDVVDDDHLRTNVLQVLARRATHPAVATDDDVATHARDSLVHPTPFEVLPDIPLGDRPDHHREVVKSDTDPEDHQAGRERLAHRRRFQDLAIAHSRQGHDRLVNRVEQVVAEDHVTHDAIDRDDKQRPDREGHAADDAHVGY
jgi:hypothetical protein